MNVKALFQILLLACLPAGLAAQVEPQNTGLPSEYWPDYMEVAERVAFMQKSGGYDVILDPIEQIALPAEYGVLAAGNWGPEYLGINARYAEIASKASRKVCVFVLDTGGAYDHPALQKVAWNALGKDFTNTGLQDAHGHSTHVAGIIGAIDINTPLGAARMLADKGLLKIVPVKVLNDQGGGTFAGITAGTLYANQQAEKLIKEGWFVAYNYSLGGGGISIEMEAALQAAEKLGVLVFSAAGNTGTIGVQYPGKSKYSTCVAALMQSGSGVQRATYSTYGPEVFTAAPGSAILSTHVGGTLKIMSGTSMATPHAAGVAAILASVHKDADAASLKAHLQKFMTDLSPAGKDDFTGWGAPLITPLLDSKPGAGPPVEPEKKREKRTLVMPMGEYNVYWKRLAEAGAPFKTLKAYVTVVITTDLYDEAAFDKAKAATVAFFNNRGFILKDEHGYADAAFYARHFYNMLVKQESGLDIQIKYIYGQDAQGREVEFDRPQTTGTQTQKKTKANRFLQPRVVEFVQRP